MPFQNIYLHTMIGGLSCLLRKIRVFIIFDQRKKVP